MNKDGLNDNLNTIRNLSLQPLFYWIFSLLIIHIDRPWWTTRYCSAMTLQKTHSNLNQFILMLF